MRKLAEIPLVLVQLPLIFIELTYYYAKKLHEMRTYLKNQQKRTVTIER